MDITRRQFGKLVAATTAMLAAPIIVADQVLKLEIEMDEAEFEKAISITGTTKMDNGSMGCVACIDQAQMWQSVYATDQWGRKWTTADGATWSCGRESFTV